MITEKYLLLDVGDTLVSITKPFEEYTHVAIKNVLIQSNSYSNDNLKHFIRYRDEIRKKAHATKRETSIRDFLINAFEKILNKNISADQVVEYERVYIQAELEITSLFDDTLPFFKKALDNDRKIFLATNNFSVQHVHALINTFNFKKYIHGVHISGECGYRKPDSMFLSGFFRKFDVPTNSALIIGDKYDMDVLSGKNFGIKTCLINRNGQKDKLESNKPDYTFSSLNEIEFS